MAKGRQFLLLLWKNYLLQKRKIILTVLEIFLPTLFAILLILVRQRVISNPKPYGQNWSAFHVDTLPSDLRAKFTVVPRVAYTPNNEAMNAVMDSVGKTLRVNVTNNGFKSEDSMVSSIMTNNATAHNFPQFLAGVVFLNDFLENGTVFPEKISYKLRLSSSPKNASTPKFSLNPFKSDTNWFTQYMFPVFQRVGPRENKTIFGGLPGYYREGFLSLQHAINKAVTKYIADASGTMRDNRSNIDMLLKRHPYPPFNDDPFVLVIQQQYPLILMLSFVLCALNIVKDLVHERERKLKESMKMMGLNNWLHWSAWFVKYFLFLLITVGIMTLFFCVPFTSKGSVIGKTDGSVIFIFLMVYAVASIAFGFAVSVFFSRANSAAAAAGVLFFVSYLPYFFIQPRYDTMSWGLKIGVSLISNVGMAMGAQVIGMFEGTGEGVQWSNIAQGVSVDDDFALLHVIVVLLVDTVFYLLITWYVEAVFPGEFGIPQPWYFPFLKTYWCGSLPEEGLVEEEEPLLRRPHHSPHHSQEFFEKDPLGLKAGIQIQNLRKEFEGGTVAVDGMNLNLYEGQITVLLGHNGAGKTTTMSMLTGFIPPTSGTAVVNGYNLRKDVAGVRSSLGLCPQHDVLFDDLTVHEHLTFFGLLKGYPKWKLPDEISRILEAIGLESKRHARSKTLSGGMKRKLSVGIALIGDSKIVILDEPSSGMDPNARRHIWGVLQKFRAGRTLLLTTHFMDEADVLGDRIAIMANGVIQCCGTSIFLKKKYGAGYHMVMVKTRNCDVKKVTELVQSYVPQANLESCVGMELSYILPEESSSQFEGLFSQVENRKEELGISSYGASVTTMEEVFLRVGETVDTKQSVPGSVGYESLESSLSNQTSRMDAYTGVEFRVQMTRNSGIYLYLQQFSAMFIKRVLHTWRNKLVTLSQLFVPLFFTIMALIVIQTFPGPQDSPPLTLTPDKFSEDTIVYSLAHWADNDSKHLAHLYRHQLKNSSSKVLFLNNQTGYRTDPDMMDYLFARGVKGLASYNRHFMVAAAIENASDSLVKTTAFFNNQAYHTPGMTLAVLANASLKYFTNMSYSMTTVNHPLPRTLNDKAQDELTKETTGFTISFNLMFGMSFLASSFVLFLVKERASKAKHIQFVSGVHSINFWMSTFCWDMINFLIPSLLIIAAFAAFDMKALVSDGRWLHMLLLFVLYGWAMLPFMYLLSFIFTVPSSGLVWLSMFNILSGVATTLAVGILSIPQLQLEYLSKALKWVFLSILPNFCLGQSIIDYYTNYQGLSICGSIPADKLKLICAFVATPCCKDHCTEFCFHYQENYLAWEPDGIGRELVFLFAQGILFFTLVLIIDSDILLTVWYKLRPQSSLVGRIGEGETGEGVREDEDVARERARIANSPRTDSLILTDLTKMYSSGSQLAVDQITLGVPQGECFGLLGINGAGKTTTFKMITGDETITYGNVYVDGSDVQTNIKSVQQKLGYCPQFDALIDQLTGRETLTMFARLRGVVEKQIPAVVDALIRSLLLEEHADKLAQHYSGGNKRKLSTAIALVGDPPIVFLDEPTTGMDPVARRLLWNTLTRVRDSGRTLILTSHSMEECEALCTRLAIMVNGQFKCLGSPQHLKAKFGEGYTLIVKLTYPVGGKEPDVGPIMGFIQQTFPGSVLKDHHEGMVHYHVHTTTMTWAEIFGTMERAKARYHIEDYSVSQTTLELVFISLARSQVPPVEREPGCCGPCRLLCS